MGLFLRVLCFLGLGTLGVYFAYHLIHQIPVLLDVLGLIAVWWLGCKLAYPAGKKANKAHGKTDVLKTEGRTVRHHRHLDRAFAVERPDIGGLGTRPDSVD
jgi:hypothetical protein